MEIHKINVNKSDEATLIAERILDAKTDSIVLAVPKFSRLAESAANFRLLKREAEALDKELLIESVDEKVLEFCKSCGIRSVNPFFKGDGKRISDIVIGSRNKAKDLYEKQLDMKKEEISSRNKGRFAASDHFQAGHLVKPRRKFSSLRKLGFFAVFAALAAGIFVILAVLPRADIKITSARTSWSYNEFAVADSSASEPNHEKVSIPGQIFLQRKNIQLLFPASGKKYLERKASGIITIYNIHSSESQALIAKTRFQEPGGKIFRLAANVVVPGAKISQGKIEPSSIEVKVIADGPGESYNIGPVERFSIPGFVGTPKAQTFYASSKEAMKGGLIGESVFPTDADIKEAKAATSKALQEVIKNFIIAQLPSEFKLIDGAARFKIIKEEVGTETDADNKFSVFLDGELGVMVFREQDLLAMLSEKLKQAAGDLFEVRKYTLKYGSSRFIGQNQFSFAVDYEASLAKTIDTSILKQRIAGRSESDLKAIIFSVASLESARISLWPFWVRRVPSNPDRINITVD